MSWAWWTAVPKNHPVYLAGVSAERLAIAVDPLPEAAPAVIFLAPVAVRSFSEEVYWLLDELDRVAISLFLQWLPDAGQFGRPSPTSISAVRALAARVAATTPNFGPFLIGLAERGFRALHGEEGLRPAFDFPAEVRAAGLARVIATAYRRDFIALVADVPIGLTDAEQRILASAGRWICNHSSSAMWFVGGRLPAVESMPMVPISLPEIVPWVKDDIVEAPSPPASTTYPAISGIPRADSAAEIALERALRLHNWASGRRWNHTIEFTAISSPYRVDLLWEAERLVVEADGDDHRKRLKYADDRVRDVSLALHGYQVMRFTNEHIISDVATVVAQIKQLLFSRRR